MLSFFWGFEFVCSHAGREVASSTNFSGLFFCLLVKGDWNWRQPFPHPPFLGVALEVEPFPFLDRAPLFLGLVLACAAERSQRVAATLRWPWYGLDIRSSVGRFWIGWAGGYLEVWSWER